VGLNLVDRQKNLTEKDWGEGKEERLGRQVYWTTSTTAQNEPTAKISQED